MAEIKEPIGCGGNLLVSTLQQGISYYWMGRDRRYKGTFFFLEASKLLPTAQALRENFAEYERIKAALPGDVEFNKTGVLQMSIRVGRVFPGVWIKPYHLGAANQTQVDEIASSYERAVERIAQLKPLLDSL